MTQPSQMPGHNKITSEWRVHNKIPGEWRVHNRSSWNGRGRGRREEILLRLAGKGAARLPRRQETAAEAWLRRSLEAEVLRRFVPIGVVL